MTVCQFCGTELMDMAEYCYRCEARLEYPGVRTGTGIKVLGKCKACSAPITIQNPSLECSGCQQEFCQSCEAGFRKCRERGEKPFCADCFPQYQDLIKRLSLGTRVPK